MNLEMKRQKYTQMLTKFKTSGFFIAILLLFTEVGFSATISVKIDSISCFGGSNGKIHVHVTSGPGTFDYALYNGNPLFGGTLIPGTQINGTHVDSVVYSGLTLNANYYVYVYDQVVITLQKESVLQPAKLIPGAITVAQGLSCSNSSDAKFKANPSGGTSPYTYLWNPSSQTTQIGTGFGIGTYTVQINDSKNCGPVTATIIFTKATYPAFVPNVITINPNPAAHTDACGALNNGSITIAASGGTGALTYSITAGGAGLYAGAGIPGARLRYRSGPRHPLLAFREVKIAPRHSYGGPA